MNPSTYWKSVLEGPLLQASSTYRYSTYPMAAHREDLAQHQYYLATFCLACYHWLDEYLPPPTRIHLGSLLAKALTHDLDELMTGDIIRRVKHHSPEITRAINDTSEVLINQQVGLGMLLPEYAEWCIHAKKGPEGVIITFIDFACVGVFCYQEFDRGNQRVAIQILRECLEEYWGFTSSPKYKSMYSMYPDVTDAVKLWTDHLMSGLGQWSSKLKETVQVPKVF